MVKKKTKSSEKSKRLPLVNAAFFCEKLLTEGDGVITAVRIVDTIGIPKQPDSMLGQIVAVQLTFFAMLKTGGAKGATFDVAIHVVSPSLDKHLLNKSSITFLEQFELGHNIITPPIAPLKWEGEGVYWYEISLNSKVISRTPLMVKIGPVETRGIVKQ
jgi:hypothetical protein